MSLQNHLSQLRRKHQDVERELRDALVHPSTEDSRILELKRLKLHLKDTMSIVEGSGDRLDQAA